MPTLAEALLTPANRPRVIRDCVVLLDNEVANKGGLSGLAVKGGYAILKKIKPTMIEDTMDSLLDDFVHRLEPVYGEWEGAGRTPGLESFLSRNSQRIANTLLGITDERAKLSKHATIKTTYEKLRPSAVKHIEEALPAVGRLVLKYA